MESEHKVFKNLPHHMENLDEEVVHSIRKGTKQLRARLNLHRDLEGTHHETERLRTSVKQLAKMLAGQRDADVMQNLLDELIGETPPSGLQTLLMNLRSNLTAGRLPDADLDQIRKLVSDIEKTTRKLDRHSYADSDIDQYLAGRLSALNIDGPALLNSNDWEGLHNWRKQVKKLMYQYELKPFMTPRDQFIYDHLDQLGSCLGKIHDYCILEDYVRQRETGCTRAGNLLVYGQIFDLINRKREGILEHCREIYNAVNTLQ